MVEKQLQSIEETLKRMQESSHESSKKLDLIHNCIVGNEAYGQKGIVNEISEMKTYIEKDKKLKSKIAGGAVVFTFLYTLLVQFWDKIFK